MNQDHRPFKAYDMPPHPHYKDAYIVKMTTIGDSGETTEEFLPIATSAEIGPSIVEVRCRNQFHFDKFSRVGRWFCVYTAAGVLLDKYPPVTEVSDAERP